MICNRNSKMCLYRKSLFQGKGTSLWGLWVSDGLAWASVYCIFAFSCGYGFYKTRNKPEALPVEESGDVPPCHLG